MLQNSPQRVQETPFDGNTHIQNPQGLGAQGWSVQCQSLSLDV